MAEFASSVRSLTESQTAVLEQWRRLAGGPGLPRASRIKLDRKPWSSFPIGIIETIREASKLSFHMGPANAALLELLGKGGKRPVTAIEGIRLGLVEVTALRRPRTLPADLRLSGDAVVACEFLLLPLSEDSKQVDAVLYHLNLMASDTGDRGPRARAGQGGLFDAKNSAFYAA